MIGVGRVANWAGLVLLLWVLVFGIVLLGVGDGVGRALGGFSLFLAAGVASHRPRRVRPSHRATAGRRFHRVAASVGYAVLAGGAVADVVVASHLARRYGATTIFVPAVALGVLMTSRVTIVPATPGRARRIATLLVWSAVCGVGVVLVSGIPSVQDKQLGGCVLGVAVGALGFLWAPVIREFNRLCDPLLSRAKRVAKALLGDWEEDVGFLGDGRGSRQRLESPKPDAERSVPERSASAT